MNSLTILIIGVPAVLAVIASKLEELQRKREQARTEPEPVDVWSFPPKWREVSKTEER